MAVVEYALHKTVIMCDYLYKISVDFLHSSACIIV